MQNDSAKLLNLVSQDYTLIRKGKYFTTEEHDSLVIDANKGVFYWNSKGLHGDVLDYLRKVKGYNLTRALNIVTELSDTYDYSIYEVQPQTPNPALIDIFYEYGKDHREYWLDKRGYTDDTIDRWKLGYTGKYYTIPIFNQGKLHNFQCRCVDVNGNRVIRNFYEGREPVLFNGDSIPDDKSIPIFITESPVETIILAQQGRCAVGNSNGAMSWQQEWSRKLFDRDVVYICYDNDEAGRAGAKRTASLLQHNSHILIWPKNAPAKFDLTDLFKTGKTLKEEWFVPSYII